LVGGGGSCSSLLLRQCAEDHQQMKDVNLVAVVVVVDVGVASSLPLLLQLLGQSLLAPVNKSGDDGERSSGLG
jgi:hypothetical protein